MANQPLAKKLKSDQRDLKSFMNIQPQVNFFINTFMLLVNINRKENSLLYQKEIVINTIIKYFFKNVVLIGIFFKSHVHSKKHSE